MWDKSPCPKLCIEKKNVVGMKQHPIFRHIKSNNFGTAKVKIIKNDRDPPLFTGKLLIKFQNILRNTTQGLPVKRGGSLSFLTIFTFAVTEILDLT
jgi:hypothetical protein